MCIPLIQVQHQSARGVVEGAKSSPEGNYVNHRAPHSGCSASTGEKEDISGWRGYLLHV